MLSYLHFIFFLSLFTYHSTGKKRNVNHYFCFSKPYIANQIFEYDSNCPHCDSDLINRADTSTINQISVETGSGKFLLRGGSRHKEKTITVFYHKPQSFTRKSPVMIVVPGSGRNGDDYRDAWIDASEKYSVLILSPKYPEKFYPGYWSYNLGGMTSKVTLDLSFQIDTNPSEWTLDEVMDRLNEEKYNQLKSLKNSPLLHRLIEFTLADMIADVNVKGTDVTTNKNKEQWIFNDFDRLFNNVKKKLSLKTKTYDVFGHSAGGQILHRFILFNPDNNADRILASNSGWYTIPTFGDEFPYGLKNTQTTEKQLEEAFMSKLVVFLGEKDNENETRGSLRNTPLANKQGPYRLARGKYFYIQSKKYAQKLNTEFNWKLAIIPNVGHDYQRMSNAAAEYLYNQ